MLDVPIATPSDRTGTSREVRFMPTCRGAPEVKWDVPGGPSYTLPPMPDLGSAPRRERAKVAAVTVLSLACTGLAIFDLFLFALRA